MTKAEKRYALIDAHAGTSKTVVEYCAVLSISRAKYNHWQLKRKRAAVATGFVEIRTEVAAARSVRLPGGLERSFTEGPTDRLADRPLQMDRRHNQSPPAEF